MYAPRYVLRERIYALQAGIAANPVKKKSDKEVFKDPKLGLTDHQLQQLCWDRFCSNVKRRLRLVVCLDPGDDHSPLHAHAWHKPAVGGNGGGGAGGSKAGSRLNTARAGGGGGGGDDDGGGGGGGEEDDDDDEGEGGDGKAVAGEPKHKPPPDRMLHRVTAASFRRRLVCGSRVREMLNSSVVMSVLSALFFSLRVVSLFPPPRV